MPLPGPFHHTAPTLCQELRIDTRGLQPVLEAAVHARHSEPHLWLVELQKWLQLRQPKLMLLDLRPCSPPYHLMEALLQFEEDTLGNIVSDSWMKLLQKMPMPSTGGYIDRTFTSGILEGPPSPQSK